MKPEIMGILNITPDSFSDGGNYLEHNKALSHARLMIAQGAKIIDVGAESTRPNSTAVNSETELERIKEVVTELAKDYTISIDTFRAQTAKTCLELGAKIINDVSALRYSSDMAKIISEHHAEVVLMYSKQDGGSPHATKEKKNYTNVIEEIRTFLSKQIDYALQQGIDTSKIILDPAMGTFISPDAKYSWEVLGKLEQLSSYFSDFRILIGTSRKGFLGAENIEVLSQITALIAVSKGVSIIRTHNVEMALRFCTVLN